MFILILLTRGIETRGTKEAIAPTLFKSECVGQVAQVEKLPKAIAAYLVTYTVMLYKSHITASKTSLVTELQSIVFYFKVPLILFLPVVLNSNWISGEDKGEESE